MREILFRGKRIDNGEWVFGDLSQHKTGKKFIKCGDARSSFEVDESTICQFTGLFDKNGKKIWENDIISYPKIHAKGNVVFVEDTFVLFDDWDGKQYINGMWNKFEVIGNVFDNKELLKE